MTEDSLLNQNRSKFLVGLILIVSLISFIFTMHLNTSNRQTRQHECDSAQSITSMLRCLEVQPEAKVTYPTDFGGEHWIRQGTCRSTRAIVLRRESLIPVKESRYCKRITGKWFSVYDNSTRYDSSNRAVEIDHLVSKKEAWQSGANDWTDAQRKAYKNDLGYASSLIAVTGSANHKKKDFEPQDDWFMTLEDSYQCEYLFDWIAVKYRWSLNVDVDEKQFLESQIKTCPVNPNFEIPQRINLLGIH